MEAVPANPHRRRWTIVITICTVAAAIAILTDPTQVILGTLLGDTFFEGRPTRYWAQKLGGGPADRAAAEDTLRIGGKNAVPMLASILRRRDSGENVEPRLIAVEMLIKLGPDAVEAGPELIQGLKDADSHLQAVCAAGLSKISVPADTAIPLLTEMLTSQHAVVAARALSDYRAAAASSLPKLVEMLQDQSLPTEVRWNAARTIGKIGPPALSTVPVLIEAMQDKAPTIREHSAEAIGDIGPTAIEGLPALLKTMHDPEPRVRRDSVRSIGYLGPAASSAAPEITKLLKDPDPRVKDAILPALKSIAPEEAKAVEKQLEAEKAKAAKAADAKPDAKTDAKPETKSEMK